MSDKDKEKDKPKGQIELPASESKGMPTEAKAGLALVLILLSAFGFMVWQRWDRTREAAAMTEQEPKSTEGDEKVAEKIAAPPQQGEEPPAFGDVPVKEVSHTKTPADDFNKAAKLPDEFPATATSSSNSNTPVLTTEHTDAGKSQALPDEFDPFAAEANPATKDAEPAKKTASNDPFGDWETDSPNQSKPAVAETQPASEDPFATPKTVEANSLPSLEVPKESTPPTLEVATDPFGDSLKPTKTTEETPTLEMKEAVADTPTLSPLEEIKPVPSQLPEISKNDPAPELTTPAFPAVTYRDPQPLLEQVPTAKVADNSPAPSFGDFEPVPVGHASTKSTTRVEVPADLVFPEQPAKTNGASLTKDPAVARLDANPLREPSNTSVVGESRNPGVYEVRASDNYWTISKNVYGTSKYFQALSLFNQARIPDATKMRPGMQVLVPKASVLEASYPSLFPKIAAETDPAIVQVSGESGGLATDLSGNTVYRVGKNDTLSQIAQKHLGRSSRWIQIYELNRDKLKNPNDLKIGTILKLPQDASRVKFVSGDAETPRR